MDREKQQLKVTIEDSPCFCPMRENGTLVIPVLGPGFRPTLLPMTHKAYEEICVEREEGVERSEGVERAERESADFIEKNVRDGNYHRCVCGAILEKNAGCNYVKCRCGQEWCWVTKLPKGSGRGHCPFGGPHNCH